MSTTKTTATITPKYDPQYNVDHTVQGLRFVGEILGEVIKGKAPLELDKLLEVFETSKDLLLYTLGWLEPQKSSTEQRICSSANILAKTVEDLIREGERTGKTPGLDLSKIATAYRECASALEQFAKHVTGNNRGEAS